MKKVGLLSIGAVLMFGPLFAQDIEKEKTPDEQIIVNKKYDENGNLIQYDSTYVHQWSSDSTFQFLFPDDDFFAGKEFPDINEFFQYFMGDSAWEGFQMPDDFGHLPFDDEAFFNQFGGRFSDSTMMRMLPFGPDSAIQHFYFNNPGNVPPGFGLYNFEEMEKRLNEEMEKFRSYNFQMPQFNNGEQEQEWQELMEKHRQEIEELKKKWEENK